MHYVSVHAGCEETDNEIFTAQVILLKALQHQEMVTNHSYNTLPSLCAAGSLHSAQLGFVEQ